MAEQNGVIAGLTAEGDAVDRLLAGLEPAEWSLPTPAAGWTIAHQVAHLTATFALATAAAAKPDEFAAVTSRLSDDFDKNVQMAMSRYLGQPPAELFAGWQGQRATAERALAALPADQIVPWLVRPLPVAVLAAAGLMELFGHGQDIHDALGVPREPADRLRYVVAFAVRTWDFGYQARGLTPPEGEFRFEITAPSGEVWQFGPEDSTERITGSALDFCLLVTRRRHRDDVDVRAEGREAGRWLDIAQAYRGPAGPGRQPGQFAALSTRDASVTR